MSDIFISYASQDRARAQVLAGELERQKWSVWWDRKTPPGRPFAEWIEEALNEAKCVIVLWSKASVKSQWVQNEADTGARQNILVPALIDDVGIPFEFRRIQAANLVDWDQRVPHSEFDLLLDAVSAIIGKPVLIRQLESTVDEQEPADAIPGEHKDTPKEEALESATDKELLPDSDEKIDRKRENAKTGDKLVKVLPAILMFAVLAVTVFLAISIHRSNLRQQKQAQQLWSETETLASDGDYEKAIEIADRLLAEYSGSKYAQQASAKKTAWQEALAKKRITELLSQAQTFKEQDEFDKALEAVEQVLVLDPENAQAKSLCTELTNEKQARQLLSQAESLASNGDYEKAIEIADTLLAEYQESKYAQQAPANKAAWQEALDEKTREQDFKRFSEAGTTYMSEGTWKEAIESYTKALAIKPEDADVLDNLATCQHNLYLSQAQEAESKEDLEAAISLYKKALSYKNVVSTQERLDSAFKARKEEHRQLEYAKRIKQAETAEKEGDSSAAIQFYQEAHEVAETQDVVFLQAKIDALRQQISEEQKRDKFNTLLANAKSKAKEATAKEALKILEEALALYPDNQEALELKKQLGSQLPGPAPERRLTEPNEIEPAAKAPLDYGSLNHRLVLDLKGDAYVKDACFSPNGDRIASADRGLVRIWDATSGTPLHTLESDTGEYKTVCFSGDGKLVASGGEWEKVIEVWDSNTGECLLAFDTEHRKDLTDICFSPDGRFIVSASDDKILKMWDVASGLFVRAFEGHSHGVYSVAFSPDSMRIASGSCDQTIKLWDAESAELLKTLTGHTSTVESLAFSADGGYIAACEYRQDRLMIWDVEAESAIVNAFLPCARCVEFSPTGRYVVSGDAYGQVHILSVESGEWVKMIKSHEGSFSGLVDINAVEFSPDGKRLLVAADNEYLKIFLFE